MSSTAPAISRTMSPLEWGMLVVLSVLWGGSFFFNGIAVRSLPPLSIVGGRVLLAALVLHVAIRLMGLRFPLDGASLRAFLGMGILNNAIPFTLIVWGQGHIASGLAAILNATTPLTTVVIVHLLTRDDRMTGNRLLGVALGLVGVVVMIGPEALRGLGDNLLAQGAVIGATISYGFSAVFSRRFQRMGIPPMVTATGQVTASSLILVPLALIVDRPWLMPAPTPEAVGALVGLAILSTALAYAIYFRILATASVTNLSLVTFLIPVSAILLGVFVLGEHLDTKHVAGMVLIAAGLAAIDGRLLTAMRRAG